MEHILLIDFGSTYTKVTAVDLESEQISGTAGSYTTVQSDINDGLQNAMIQLAQTAGPLKISARYACSSAAGGLRMLAGGLVPELTAQAARLTALGAGAKVLKTYSHHLVRADIREIDSLSPDIFLLTGGTDGGNSECILHNAGMLAATETSFPVIVAGNRSCADECADLLGERAIVCENVMPRLDALNVTPAQTQIRELFLQRIIQAKGLSRAAGLVSGILMPTPAAMLDAMCLLADGTEEEPGIGELMGIDLGGATTDIYSIAHGHPTRSNTVAKGLPEPYAKRTVEGDIGMRYSIHGIVEAAGISRVAELSGIAPTRVQELVDLLGAHTNRLPDNQELMKLDYALACCAVETAAMRHAGTIEEVFTPMGKSFMQLGKDLGEIDSIVVTGGALIHSSDPVAIARHAFASPRHLAALCPQQADILVDKRYILAAMGLLGKYHPNTALRIMKKELQRYGTEEQTP